MGAFESLGAPWRRFWRLSGGPGGSLGVPWVPRGCLGRLLGDPWGALGVLWGSLGSSLKLSGELLGCFLTSKGVEKVKSRTSKIIEILLVFVIFSRSGGRKGDHGGFRGSLACLGGVSEGSRRVLWWSLGVLGASLRQPWGVLGDPWGARGVRGGAFEHTGQPGLDSFDQRHGVFAMLL